MRRPAMELQAGIRAFGRSERTGVAAMEGRVRGGDGDRAGRSAWLRGLRAAARDTETGACAGTAPIRTKGGRRARDHEVSIPRRILAAPGASHGDHHADDHGRPTARTPPVRQGRPTGVVGSRGRGLREQGARVGQARRATGVGEIPKVPDAHEARGRTCWTKRRRNSIASSVIVRHGLPWA